jgi:hypothetical protein
LGTDLLGQPNWRELNRRFAKEPGKEKYPRFNASPGKRKVAVSNQLFPMQQS